jgi:hypothetical protein
MMSANLKPEALVEIVRGFVDQESFSPGEIGRACRRVAGGDSADPEVLREIMFEVMVLARTMRGLKSPPPAPVALVRRQRFKGDNWLAQKTWLGGLPTLSGEAWPRGSDGRPLHHIARLDLAEIKLAAPELPLPDGGALSFFFSETNEGSEGAVRFAPPGENAKTSPPPDMPPAYEEDGNSFPPTSSRATHDRFPYWPLEAIRLDLPPTLPAPSLDYNRNQLIWDAQLAALHARFPERRTDFGVQSAHNAGLAGAQAMWWHGAILMREKLAIGCSRLDDTCRSLEATVAKLRQYLAGLDRTKFNYEKDVVQREQYIAQQSVRLAELQRTVREVAPFMAALDAFVAGREPWDELNEGDIEQLEKFRAQLRSEFRLAFPGNSPFSLDSIRSISVEGLMTESDAFFAKLPDDLIAFINDHYRTPTRNFHHMFGLGADVQEAPYRHLGDHLLLQIAYDSLAQMRFGDVGAVQFWIAPKDLDAQRWDKVAITFEGH